MCLSPGKLQLLKWGICPTRRKSLISDLFCKKQSETENRDLTQKSTMLRLAEVYPQGSSGCWGAGAQRQKLLQGTGRTQAEGEPDSGSETDAQAVLGGSTEVKKGVYKTTGWAFTQHWANPLQDRKSVCVCGSRSYCFMPSFRLPLS